MSRTFAATSIAIGAVALAVASFTAPSAAQAFGPRFEDGPPPAYGWRPPPPAMHGYWGYRRWRHYNEGFRPPPPPPYGYGYGWR
jgi:hypothetical protein